MGVKNKPSGEDGDAPAESYEIDWCAQERRPFKRGFVPYGSDAAEGEAVKKRKSLGLELIEDPAGDDATPMPLDSFEELGVLPPWLLDALRDEFRYEPTPLQAQALPIALAGQNMVVVAPSSRGQPGAYLLAAAVHADDQAALEEEDPGPIALVLTPTQETANRATEEAESLLAHSARSERHPGGLRAVCVSGGGTRSEKLKELTAKSCHIMIGTPKRVHDMASKEQISLLRVTSLILDGADRMLELGFETELRELAKWVRPERQTSIFSATWPRPLHELSREICFAGGDPVRFSAKGTAEGAEATAAGKTPAKATAKGKAVVPKAKLVAKAAPKAKAPAKVATEAEEEMPPEDAPEEW